MKQIVLASRSPRRAEILRNAGIPFEVRAPEVDESRIDGEPPGEYVRRMARMKAEAIETNPDEIVLGADTTVVLGSEVLGKPADDADARRMLELLSGREHTVMTGICLLGSQTVIDAASTTVRFSKLSAVEIEDYIRSREPMDKAGAYAIQGLASKFATSIEGCYFNVMGLPVAMVYSYLRQL